jgi:hypothetical protein
MLAIGRCVLEMLEGTLEQDPVKRWAWDRKIEGGAHAHFLPKLGLRYLWKCSRYSLETA